MTRVMKIRNTLVIPDIKYNSVLVSRLVNVFMLSGKKTLSRKLIYSVLTMIKQKYLCNPLDIINFVFTEYNTLVDIKYKKIGGSILVVPYRISKYKSVGINIRWLKNFVFNYKNKSNLSFIIFKEIVNAYNGCGILFIKRLQLYKVVLANRAFSHLV